MPRRPHDAEIIELLPLDDAPDWLAEVHGATATPFTPPGRSSRTVALGFVAALAVVAGAVWLSSTDGEDTAASTTTTTVPPTSTTVRVVDPANTPLNLVIDDIVGLQPYLAENPSGGTPDTDARTQLWRSVEGDTFVLVESHRLDSADDDTEPEFDGTPREGILGIDPIGVLADPSRTVIRYNSDGWRIRIEARGVTDQALLPFAASVLITPSGPEFDAATLPLTASIATSRIGTADQALMGVIDSRTLYWSVGTRELVTISTGLSELGDRRSVRPVMITDLQESNGRSWGRLAADPSTAIVQWTIGDDRLATATARMAPEMLLAVTSRTREASAQEWRALVYGLRPDYRIGSFAAIGAGTTDNGIAWSAGVQRAERRGTDELLWWWSVPYRANGTSLTSVSMPTRSDVVSRPQFATVVYPDVTYVLASVPADDPATSVQIASDGGPLEQVDLIPPFDGAPVRVAVAAITAKVPLTVLATGPDGNSRWLPGGAAPPSTLVTAPDGFRLVDARTFESDFGEEQPFEIWTSNVDSAWFMASVQPADLDDDVVGSLDRRVIPGEEWDVVIDAFGVAPDRLDLLAASATSVSGRVIYRTSPFEYDFDLALTGESPTIALLGSPLAELVFADAGSDRPPIYLLIGTDSTLTSAFQPFAIADIQKGQLADLGGTWAGGALHLNNAVTVVQWGRGGLQYTLAGEDGLAQLLTMIGVTP